MYLTALAFIYLFDGFTFMSGVTGALKGLYLGLLVGIPFFALPAFVDGSYFKTKDSILWTVILNWVAALAILGLVVGALR
jgi:hypothetical protein